MMRDANSPENLVWYSDSTRKADVMILDGQLIRLSIIILAGGRRLFSPIENFCLDKSESTEA